MVSCGEIVICNETYRIIVGRKKNGKRQKSIYLTEKDIDHSWYERIINEANIYDSKSNIFQSEPKDSLYIRLYVLYSINRYAYFANLISVIGLEKIIEELNPYNNSNFEKETEKEGFEPSHRVNGLHP